MTKFRVIIAPQALQELDNFIAYIAIEKQSPLNAERWLKKALRAIDTLSHFPHRCPIAPESKQASFIIRMLIVDSASFLYRVEELQSAVHVIHFIAAGKDRTSPSAIV